MVRERSMASMKTKGTLHCLMTPHEQIPNEILLEIISYFTLKSLIAARGVNRQWRQFIDLADVHPIRRDLLNLYLRVVRAPWFLQTRAWVFENLRPFDRQAYIQALSQYRCRIPMDFYLWILEWPARAAFQAIWPGLPNTEVGSRFNPLTRASGINSIGILPPILHTITYRDWIADEQTGEEQKLDTYVPGLAIREERHGEKIWLLLDESDVFHGMVLCTEIHTMFEQDDNPMTVAYDLEPTWLGFLEKERQVMDSIYTRMPSDFVTPPPSPPNSRPVARFPLRPEEWPKIADS